jgi:MFS family permease
MDSTTKSLNVSLTVMQVLNGFYILWGLFMMVAGSFVAQLLSQQYSRYGSVFPSWLFLILGLWTVAYGVVTILLLNWAKEWQARASEWTRGISIDTARLQKLTTTLDRWMIFSQWSTLILAALALVFPIFFSALLGRSISGAGFPALILVIGILIGAAPPIVINWLILGNIRTWILEVNNRIVSRKNTLNLMEQSKKISSWFVFCQVIIGIVILLDVFTLISSLGSSTIGVTQALFSIAVYVFLGMILEWSKRFAVDVSAYADRHT